MQATPRPPTRKAPKFLDAKMMIAALSAVVTVGFWNLFASQAAQAQDSPEALAPEALEESAPSEEQAGGLPPVPTLVPVMDLSNSVPAAAQSGQAAPLRSVAQPTVVVVQKNKPLIDAPAQVVVNGGGGGRSSRPAATTRSSR